ARASPHDRQRRPASPASPDRWTEPRDARRTRTPHRQLSGWLLFQLTLNTYVASGSAGFHAAMSCATPVRVNAVGTYPVKAGPIRLKPDATYASHRTPRTHHTDATYASHSSFHRITLQAFGDGEFALRLVCAPALLQKLREQVMSRLVARVGLSRAAQHR